MLPGPATNGITVRRLGGKDAPRAELFYSLHSPGLRNDSGFCTSDKESEEEALTLLWDLEQH